MNADGLDGVLGIDLGHRGCLGGGVCGTDGAGRLYADDSRLAAHNRLSGKRRHNGVLAVDGRGDAAALGEARCKAGAAKRVGRQDRVAEVGHEKVLVVVGSGGAARGGHGGNRGDGGHEDVGGAGA